jgi:hypothetical protein
MILFGALYFVFYLLGRPVAPRYFLGLYPILAIGMGVGVAAALRGPGRWLRGVILVAAVLLVTGGGLTHLHLADVPGLREILGRPMQRETSVRTEPGGVIAVVEWLRARRIHNVFAAPPLKWKLMFHGHDWLRGSSSFTTYIDDGKLPALALAFQAALDRDEAYAFVFHREFRYQGLTGGWVAVRGPAVAAATRRSHALYLVRAKGGPPGREMLVPYPEFFFDSLRRAGVYWETEEIGEYVVVHGFRGPSPIQVLRPLLPWVRPR